ncbi:MAG TPA: alpha/beta hydrolase [Streptosporangiaceae bacterium]|nr:alpha/beta hydrolase [Streptosporangiaceae bacterium]
MDVRTEDNCRLWTAATGPGKPGARRVVLPDAGHIPWLEKPGEFAGHLLGFLSQ